MTRRTGARRTASFALLAGFCLLSICLGSGDAPQLAAIAAAGTGALLVFSRPSVSAALSGFAPAIEIVVEQALIFAAMSRTGGLRSPAGALLPIGVALAWELEGRPAARFSALLSAAGAAALVALGGFPAGASGLLAAAAVPLAAPALLAAFELGARREAAPGRLAAADDARLPARDLPAAAVRAEAATPPRSEGERHRLEAVLHDLRSPLSVLRVYSDLIGEGARRGELPNPEHLANLSREIELAERLVAGGAAPSGGKAANPESVPAPADLVEILGSLATAYRLSLAGRRRIEFIAEKPELPVAADPVALQRAFRNVLENAIKYTGEGGEIRIRAGPAGPHAFVVVKDTGIGMSAEERTRAFDYGFRAAGAVASGTGGKGIGLAVTKQILEANGGRISLSSEAGYGSEVTILLPFAAGRPVKRIVVVDDDESVGPAVRELLADDEIQVDSPGDAAAALPELIRAAPDLVILDVNMPGYERLGALCDPPPAVGDTGRPDSLPDGPP